MAKPRTTTTIHNTIIAQAVRCATAVSGPISSNATLIDRNDAPQMSDNTQSSIHARADMDCCLIMRSYGIADAWTATRNMRVRHAKAPPQSATGLSFVQ
jgi:hypothetical protein